MKNTKGKTITLGIDIGVSSIGWALVEDQKKFIDGGVHIFTNGGEEQTNTTRREKRLQRKQTRRRSMRIRRLVHALAGTAMLPIASTANLRQQLDKAARLPKKERHATTTSPAIQALKDFFDLVPWTLRKKAIEGQRLTPQELGRVFYHFAHQRGFPKNSLRTLEGDKKAEEEAKTLKEGSPKDDKIGADTTQAGIAAIPNKAQHYLGYYLATLFPSKGTPPYQMPERIRSRYTYREMYKAEFEHIWQTQRRYHPQLLTPQRKAAIKHILFFQLPLQTPPRGQCTFEQNKKRAYLASLLFEEFRAHQYINNFLAQYGITTPAARQPFLAKAIAEFLSKKSKITPTQLAKKLQLTKTTKDDPKKDTLDKEAQPMGRAEFQFTTELRNLFGPEIWDAYTPAEKNDRWHIIFRKISHLKDLDSLAKYAKKHWQFNDKQITDLCKITIPKGVGNISEKAIRYILPYLKRGYLYDQAVLLGSISKAFGHHFDPA
ncbi:MAG: type II CRISPR RNA-guided endonuclease Cas9, partial [Bacteroidota bacterium]